MHFCAQFLLVLRCVQSITNCHLSAIKYFWIFDDDDDDNATEGKPADEGIQVRNDNDDNDDDNDASAAADNDFEILKKRVESVRGLMKHAKPRGKKFC